MTINDPNSQENRDEATLREESQAQRDEFSQRMTDEMSLPLSERRAFSEPKIPPNTIDPIHAFDPPNEPTAAALPKRDFLELPPMPDEVRIPDIYDQIWLGLRTMMAMKFYEHSSNSETPLYDWNSLDLADKTRFYEMAQSVMSNGEHDVVYGMSVERRSRELRLSDIASTVRKASEVPEVAKVIAENLPKYPPRPGEPR